MEVCCDLEVDVNGEEIFLVDKKVIAPFSCRFCKLLSKSKGNTRNLRVIFHNFPGGAQGFELMARFCYNNGRIEIVPSNVVLLNCAAHFMEMDSDCSGSPNLIDQTEKSLEGISYWTWSELLVALKQCQELHTATTSSFILEKVINYLVEKLALLSIVSPYASFSENSNFQLSYDTRSTDSSKITYSQRSWWFEDLLILDINLIEKVVSAMVGQKFEHSTIYKFLFCYQKSRCVGASRAEKCKITGIVINLLSLLDRSSLSCKGLFDIFRVASTLKLSKIYKNKLESLIGSLLDQATVDHLLVPSPLGKNYMYDVSLVLRLVNAFLLEGSCWILPSQWKKVARLMDSYISEVAPDSHLKPSKFAALVMVLPDSARESYDGIYRAMDMYLEVHAGLCEEEKMRFCCALNCEKLSAEILKHLAQNSKFPSRTVLKALTYQQSKLESLLQDTDHLKTFIDSLFCNTINGNSIKQEDAEHNILHEKTLNHSTENRMFAPHLQAMLWRVKEMEKVFNNLQTQTADIRNSRSSRLKNTKSLPKLCS